MKARALLFLIGMTVVLWITPSIGTQGMGTIGRRIVHTDAVLFDADPARRPAARATVQRSDDVVETALGM